MEVRLVMETEEAPATTLQRQKDESRLRIEAEEAPANTCNERQEEEDRLRIETDQVEIAKLQHHHKLAEAARLRQKVEDLV